MHHRVLILAAIAALCLSLGGCAKNPATGKYQLSTLSKQDEIALGASEMPKIIEEFGGAYPDAEAQAYVNEVGRRVAAIAERDYSGIPWEFTLLNSDIINAFALPGGKVFITTGLASKFDSEEELAGVLGHECGHVTAKHTEKRMAESTLYQGAASVAGAAIGDQTAATLISTGTGIILLKFSRGEESEADTLGLRYMTAAGYNPRGLLRVMEVLKASAGAGGNPEFLSTHPLPETRIDAVNRALREPPYSTATGRADPRWQSEYRARLLDRLGKVAPQQRNTGPAPQAQPTQQQLQERREVQRLQQQRRSRGGS